MSFCNIHIHIHISFVPVSSRRLKILLNEKQASNIEEAIRYYDMMASYIDELREMQVMMRTRIRLVLG
jgi:hypothetical protein